MHRAASWVAGCHWDARSEAAANTCVLLPQCAAHRVGSLDSIHYYPLRSSEARYRAKDSTREHPYGRKIEVAPPCIACRMPPAKRRGFSSKKGSHVAKATTKPDGKAKPPVSARPRLNPFPCPSVLVALWLTSNRARITLVVRSPLTRAAARAVAQAGTSREDDDDARSTTSSSSQKSSKGRQRGARTAQVNQSRGKALRSTVTMGEYITQALEAKREKTERTLRRLYPSSRLGWINAVSRIWPRSKVSLRVGLVVATIGSFSSSALICARSWCNWQSRGS